jgi:Flp pilus assembly protein TadG
VTPTRLSDARGAVLLEFLLAIIPVLLLFLGSVQYVLLAVADLVVRHAALTGVRAAIVVLADDPQHYEGEALGSVQRAGLRVATIRRAVASPLAAIAPEVTDLAFAIGKPTSLHGALGTSPAQRYLNGTTFYDRVATAITFPQAPLSTRLIDTSLERAEAITLRVTHLYRCAVPLADALFCASLLEHRLRSSLQPATAQALEELERAPLSSLHQLLALGGMRFRILRAEATLPSQFAPEADDAS